METTILSHSKLTLLPILANFHLSWFISKSLPMRFLEVQMTSTMVNRHLIYSRISPCSKKSPFQDFQGFEGFAKPLRLLPATKPNSSTKYISEGILSSSELDESNAFYVVELQTSNDFGSGLRDLNAAILLCLIDINSAAILQRISAVSYENPEHEKLDITESINFQRGSVDFVTFKGPKLGKIVALWIGLESGSWRLDDIRLTVIYGPLSSSTSKEDIKEHKYHGMQYEFEADNVPLGEGGISVAELKPVLVTELSDKTISSLTSITSASRMSTFSNEESMKEYMNLKLSLLVYDLMLVTAGSAIAAFVAGEKSGYAFLFGGTCGFLYLLLLQRSVDGLSSTTALPVDGDLEKLGEVQQGFKGPLFSFALILLASIAAVKYGFGDASVVLTPMELLIGSAGFLTCKIAVVLAAFRPFRHTDED